MPNEESHSRGIVAILVVLLCVPGMIPASKAGSDAGYGNRWNIFRGSSALTGVAEVRLPDKLTHSWTFTTGAEVKSSAAIDEKHVYVGSADGHVYALHRESGELVWKCVAQGGVEAPVLLVGNSVYVGSLDGFFLALETETGQERWRHDVGAKITGSANWLPDAKGKPASLVLGSYDSTVRCLALEDGKLLWSFTADSYVNGTPSVNDSRVVFGGCDALLRVLDGDKGTELFSVEAGSYVAGSAAVIDNHAFFGNFENQFMCVALADRKIVWTYTDEEESGPFLSSPAIGSDRIVVGSRDGRVHCVSRKTGKRLWAFRTDGDVDSSPVICGNKALVGSSDGRLYLLQLSNGSVLWQYEIGEAITTSPAVVPDLVVVGADDGNVYGFTWPTSK